MSTNQFELIGNLTVEDVPDVRRFIESMQRRISNDDDQVSRVAMATHELLENAVKFSSDGSTCLHIKVGGSHVSITTRNRARPDDLEELERIARSLAASLDPMKFYIEQMARMQVGGLGLGRVAAEAEMKLDLVFDGDLVQIKAEATLGA